MSEDNNSADTPQGTTGETEVTEQVDVQVTGDDTTGEQTSTQGQTKEDNFFDPKQVPEELMPAYKSMQSAFTKKTQEIANFKKDAEGWKTKAENYGKYEQYIPIIEEMLSSKDQGQGENSEMVALEQKLRGEGYSEEAVQMMKIGAGFILNQFNQTQESQKQSVAIETGITEAEKVDPRLNDENLTYQMQDGKTVRFGEIVANLTISNPDWAKDPVGATKNAIAIVDAMLGRAKTEGKEELSNSAKTKSRRFPNLSSSPQSAAGNENPSSIHEAAAQAKKELGI